MVSSNTSTSKDRPGRIAEISLVVPTYNERENLPLLVERIAKSLDHCRYEIIVVDDGSPDGTAEVATELSHRYPLRVIHRRDEKGLASAVVAGFKNSRSQVLGVMDADLQHPPEMIAELLRAIQGGADLAIASRYVAGASILNWGIPRKLISQIALLAAKLLLPRVRQVRDPLSGFFLLRRQAIDGVELNPTGYKILLEILVKGRASKVTEIPFLFTGRGRGESKMTIHQALLYVKHVHRLAGLEIEETFLKFCAVGFSGVIVNVGLLWLFTELVGLYYLISAAFSIEASILSNFTLNELWTFRRRREGRLASILRRALRFNLVSLMGLAINLVLLWVLTQALGMNYLISSLIGIVGATLWNFGANNRWTWATRYPKGRV